MDHKATTHSKYQANDVIALEIAGWKRIPRDVRDSWDHITSLEFTQVKCPHEYWNRIIARLHSDGVWERQMRRTGFKPDLLRYSRIGLENLFDPPLLDVWWMSDKKWVSDLGKSSSVLPMRMQLAYLMGAFLDGYRPELVT